MGRKPPLHVKYRGEHLRFTSVAGNQNLQLNLLNVVLLYELILWTFSPSVLRVYV